MNGTLKPSTLDLTADRRLRIPHVWRNRGTFVMFVLLVSNALPIDYRKRISGVSEKNGGHIRYWCLNIVSRQTLISTKVSNKLLNWHLRNKLRRVTEAMYYYKVAIKLSSMDESFNVDCRSTPTWYCRKLEN